MSLGKVDDLLSIFERPSTAKLPEWVKGCYGYYPLSSLRSIRRLIALHNPPIQEVIDSGVVPQIIKLLKTNNYNFSMFFNGYIREMDFNYVVPEEIANYIDNICGLYCVDEVLQNCGRNI